MQGRMLSRYKQDTLHQRPRSYMGKVVCEVIKILDYDPKLEMKTLNECPSAHSKD